jgi:multidrug efflux pump subunit AcrA (membrane-fusion protein)
VTGRNRAEARAAASDENASVLDASGYVTARRQATVSSKVTGKVREVLIEEGQRVAADEVLAYLDDTEAKTDEGLALARLAASRAALGEIRAMLADAEREQQRQQDMHARKLGSQQALDAARTQVDAMQARLAQCARADSGRRDASCRRPATSSRTCRCARRSPAWSR